MVRKRGNENDGKKFSLGGERGQAPERAAWGSGGSLSLEVYKRCGTGGRGLVMGLDVSGGQSLRSFLT